MGVPTVRDAEWGLYSNFPPKITDYLQKEFDFNPDQLNKFLHEYQHQTRVSFSEEFLDDIPIPSGTPNAYWRQMTSNLAITPHGLAKALCVQRADLYRAAFPTFPTLPQTVSQALLLIVGHENISLGLDYIAKLRSLYPN